MTGTASTLGVYGVGSGGGDCTRRRLIEVETSASVNEEDLVR